MRKHLRNMRVQHKRKRTEGGPADRHNHSRFPGGATAVLVSLL